MSSVQVQQDPDSFIWRVADDVAGVQWSFVAEADARDAAETLDALVGSGVLLPAGRHADSQRERPRVMSRRTRPRRAGTT